MWNILRFQNRQLEYFTHGNTFGVESILKSLRRVEEKRDILRHPSRIIPVVESTACVDRPFPSLPDSWWRGRENNALEIQMTERRKGRGAIYQIKAALQHGRMPVRVGRWRRQFIFNIKRGGGRRFL